MLLFFFLKKLVGVVKKTFFPSNFRYANTVSMKRKTLLFYSTQFYDIKINLKVNSTDIPRDRTRGARKTQNPRDNHMQYGDINVKTT